MNHNDRDEIIEKILKDAVSVFDRDSLVEKLKSGKTLKIKMGADPSSPDLHIGHSVILRKLRLFQQLSHKIIFVIGDFTAMIGDPTGRNKTRPALTLSETRKSGETYFKQVAKILDKDKTAITYNSEWLSKLGFHDVINLSSKYTLARILERDDFKNRYANNIPISLHELLYPLAQGYDSVAIGADVECGGTDQTFNLLVGRALQADYGQTPQEVITYPLLPGLDGQQKMSKSLGNAIGLNDEPEVMFEKAMRIPDHLMTDYFTLTTDFERSDVLKIISEDIRKAHFVYARTITEIYHSKEDAQKAEMRYMKIASGGIPENTPSLVISQSDLTDGQISICELLKKAGFAGSNGEAKRMIANKGVKLNGNLTERPDLKIELSKPIVLQYGKNRFVKITLS